MFGGNNLLLERVFCGSRVKVRSLVSFGFIGVAVECVEQVFFAYSILFCLIVAHVRVITAAVSCN